MYRERLIWLWVMERNGENGKMKKGLKKGETSYESV